MFSPRRDAFLNANNNRNKDLRESNTKRSDEQDMVITSSRIPTLLKSLFLKLFAVKKVSLATWWAYWSQVIVARVNN